MILCSHFLWFCDVESDVTIRDVTPNHSQVGGSSTAHCATPGPVNLEKIQDEEMNPFNSPSTAQRALHRHPEQFSRCAAVLQSIPCISHTKSLL